MRFGDALDKVGRRFDKAVGTGTKDGLFIGDKVNEAHVLVGKSWDWKPLYTYASIQAIAVVETSANLTAGSQSVTVSGASSDWQGRFFRVKGGENLYRIMNVSGTTLTFDSQLVESGAKDVEIEKRYYRLPDEARRIVGWERASESVISYDAWAIREMFPGLQYPLADDRMNVHGLDEFASDYSTGTITFAKDSDVVTGTGTSWLGNIFPGARLRLAESSADQSKQDEYRIKRIETDGRIITYNRRKGDEYRGNYVIAPDKPMTARLYGSYSKNKIVPYIYVRNVFPMINDNDETGLPEEADNAILDFAEAYAARRYYPERHATLLLAAQAALTRTQQLHKPVRSSRPAFVPGIPGGMGRGAWGG